MLSFHVKFVQTDGRTDRRTMVKQYVPRSFDTGQLKKNKKNEQMHGRNTRSGQDSNIKLLDKKL